MANPTSKVNLVINGVTTQLDVHDANAVPLAGTNALAGSIVPDTGASYDLGNSSYTFRRGYFDGLYSGLLASSTNDSGVTIWGGNSWNTGATAVFYGKDNTANAGAFRLRANDGANSKELIGKPNGTLTWGSKNVAMQEDVVPRSGGAVLTGSTFSRSVDTDNLTLNGGTSVQNGASLELYGENRLGAESAIIIGLTKGSENKRMYLNPYGTWTWDGSAVQITSDQRLKQQITQIDDDLLTAWEDVEPVQFKYNDAVKEKSDNARLHTGYVVQQIDTACKSHGVDISQYGLYCHEECAEETREVEHDDGTKTTEVVRPASEHYSLRYTEALIVECAYLRKCIKELRAEIEELKSSK